MHNRKLNPLRVLHFAKNIANVTTLMAMQLGKQTEKRGSRRRHSPHSRGPSSFYGTYILTGLLKIRPPAKF